MNKSTTVRISITANASTKLVRNDTMEGRSYLVAPMVMITEGVHAGSDGPLFYPGDELSKSPFVWNHKPIVVYHPQIEGKGVSACDPKILSASKIGVIMNAKYEDGKLKAEAWMEEDRILAVDARIKASIDAEAVVEVSTGVLVDNDQVAGDWNGEAYAGTARNLRPDHLAVLPDQVGACSVAKGAGLVRNKQADDSSKLPERPIENRLTTNALSFSDIEGAIRLQLRERFAPKPSNKSSGESGPWLWVVAVYDSFVIYELEGGSKSSYWKLAYTQANNSVQLSSENPIEVTRHVEYRDAEGNLITNKNQNMNRKEIIDSLVANHGWSEDDRKFLTELPEERFAKIATPVTNKGKEPEENKEPAKTEPKVVENAQTEPKKPATVEEFISNAPAEIREVLQGGLEAHKEEKSKLVAVITANAKNRFSKEGLESKPLSELRAIAEFARPPASFEGQGGQGGESVTHNSGTSEPLVAPAMEW